VNVCLISVRIDGGHTDVPMKRPSVKIGRGPTADIRIPVASVSREHCEIASSGGALRIRDLGSSNGTYVNRKRVQEAELKPGDLVGVGPAVFVVQVDGEPSQIHATRFFEEGAAPSSVSQVPSKEAERAAKKRPSSPASKPKSAPAGKPGAPSKPARKSLLDDEDDDLDMGLDASGSGSFSDIDFDDLKDDDDDPPTPKGPTPPAGGKKK
jgi:pSer/pThr/pTyr-binding forkhead associated (FHA) protein